MKSENFAIHKNEKTKKIGKKKKKNFFNNFLKFIF